MRSAFAIAIALGSMCLPLYTGCQWTPKHQLTASEAQNRALTEQSRAQLAQIENYKAQAERLEKQVAEAEEELAQLDRDLGGNGRQLVNYSRSGGGLNLAAGRLPASLSGRLVALSERYPALEYDAETGVSKFDTDVLFDTGQAELRPEASRMLADFASIIRSHEADSLRFMIVGHTDDQQIAKRETRDQFPTNWHLSSARALAVADYLRAHGLDEPRLGVAGFGSQQPVARNETDAGRQQNRRVEIFVLGPQTPLVGWVDSTSSLY